MHTGLYTGVQDTHSEHVRSVHALLCSGSLPGYMADYECGGQEDVAQNGGEKAIEVGVFNLQHTQEPQHTIGNTKTYSRLITTELLQQMDKISEDE